MLKVRKIKLSGFRGILNPQELDLSAGGSKEPKSLVLFGLNSSGKTSFVDGLEWFLSPANKIDWLRRDEAEEKAYPHQAAKEKGIDSFVELEFSNSPNPPWSLTKSFNLNRPTKPTLSDEVGFKGIYSTFVIRPYFRYLEIVDFVCSKGKEKYERLAQWMGFESEFTLQETLARGVQLELKKYEKQLSDVVTHQELKLKQLMQTPVAIEDTVLSFCNVILKGQKIPECKRVSDLWKQIPELTKKRRVSSEAAVVTTLSRLETSIGVVVLNDKLCDEVDQLEVSIQVFRKNKELVSQINVIGIYTKGLEILTKQTAKKTNCPLCGSDWDRESLMDHIKHELNLLQETKEARDAIANNASALKKKVEAEITSVERLIGYYTEVGQTVGPVKHPAITTYLQSLKSLVRNLDILLTQKDAKVLLPKAAITKVTNERGTIGAKVKSHKAKVQPSAEEVKLSDDIERLSQAKTDWMELVEARCKQQFALDELNKFYALRDEVVRTVQENIKSRFEDISDSIGRYFAILRNDKDISDIKIVLNEERGAAAGRSAEIELNYYNISVRPAYKILSESLLNSLGLAVYFTCVKQFNEDCGFIFLDDVMNSLDIDKRDTLLELIAKEFADHQIVIFTHDYFWFQKIMRMFPRWEHKKIKDWDYIGGAKIDPVFSTKQEIETLLSDSTKTEVAGWTLGKHVESMLNELCEKLWAPVRYRYTKNELPAMDELFDALYVRLKNKVKLHSATVRVIEAKKCEPLLRNFVSHSRDNQPASVHPNDVRRACDEWFALQAEFECDKCNRLVEYHQSKDSIECKCGAKQLVSPNN